MLLLLILSLFAQTVFSCARPLCYTANPSSEVDNVFLADIMESTYTNTTGKSTVTFRPVCSYKSTIDVLGKNITSDDVCTGRKGEVGTRQLVFVKSMNVEDGTAVIDFRCAGDGIRNATKEEIEKVYADLKDKKAMGECITVTSFGTRLSLSWVLLLVWIINVYLI
jgi:hypothetical protein